MGKKKSAELPWIARSGKTCDRTFALGNPRLKKNPEQYDKPNVDRRHQRFVEFYEMGLILCKVTA